MYNLPFAVKRKNKGAENKLRKNMWYFSYFFVPSFWFPLHNALRSEGEGGYQKVVVIVLGLSSPP